MEEAAILAAIAQFPHEDTPRLAYADWLDDHADALPEPDAARIRAEFIRLQCELKRYEDVTGRSRTGTSTSIDGRMQSSRVIAGTCSGRSGNRSPISR
jgi:uncharacterized protein (TIGR02996 family)